MQAFEGGGEGLSLKLENKGEISLVLSTAERQSYDELAVYIRGILAIFPNNVLDENCSAELDLVISPKYASAVLDMLNGVLSGTVETGLVEQASAMVGTYRTSCATYN